jgi:hypothetical protein
MGINSHWTRRFKSSLWIDFLESKQKNSNLQPDNITTKKNIFLREYASGWYMLGILMLVISAVVVGLAFYLLSP